MTESHSEGRAIIEDRDFKALLDSTPDPMVVVDRAGTIVLVNRQLLDIFGYTAGEILGQSIETLVPMRLHLTHVARRNQYLRNPTVRAMGSNLDLLAVRKDGSEFPAEISLSPIRTGGELLVASAIRDVSERKQIQAELSAAHQRVVELLEERTRQYRLGARQQEVVADLGRHIMEETDMKSIYQRALDTVADTMGMEHGLVLELCDESLEMRASIGFPGLALEDATVSLSEKCQTVLTLKSASPIVSCDLSTETRFVTTPAPRTSGIASSASVCIGRCEAPLGVLAVYASKPRDYSPSDIHFLQSVGTLIADASLRHRKENALEAAKEETRKQARMADVGAISAKIVHDLGNPVAGLLMQAQLISRSVKRDAPIQSIEEPADHILAIGKHLDSTIREFRDFLRVQRLRTRAIPLAEFLEGIIRHWMATVGRAGVQFKLDMEADFQPIVADESKLRRVFDNLIVNAIEAFDGEPGRVEITAKIEKPETLWIDVADDGPGIDTDLDVFQLFETTKPEGTGIGLAVCREIVRAHGGDIHLESNSPSGARFVIQLPVHGPKGPSQTKTPVRS